MRRFSSTLYLPFHRNKQTKVFETDPHGYLFAQGKYPTKIFAEHLPEWYVGGYMHGQHGYISAKGVKHLLYQPNYTTNHIHKDDLLYISYDTPIEQDEKSSPGKWYHGYDQVISGHLIVDFLKAVAVHSEYDTAEIMKEVEKKEQWYQDNWAE